MLQLPTEFLFVVLAKSHQTRAYSDWRCSSGSYPDISRTTIKVKKCPSILMETCPLKTPTHGLSWQPCGLAATSPPCPAPSPPLPLGQCQLVSPPQSWKVVPLMVFNSTPNSTAILVDFSIHMYNSFKTQASQFLDSFSSIDLHLHSTQLPIPIPWLRNASRCSKILVP